MNWFEIPEFYQWGCAFGFWLCLFSGAVVWILQPRRADVRRWATLCFCVANWFAGRWLIFNAVSAQEAYKWQRLMYFGTTPLNVVYFHFVLEFLRERRFRQFLFAGYVIAAILVLSNLSTHLFVTHMQPGTVFRFYEHPGPLYNFHTALYFLYPGAGVALLLRARRLSNGLWRTRIGYVAAASIVGFLCGLTTLPLVFDLLVLPVGAPFVSLYVFIIAYAIVKHQLMDIRIVIRKTLIYSVVTAALTLVYVLIATLAARALERSGEHGHFYPSAAAAVVVTLLFNPLLNKVRRWMEGHLFGDWLKDMSRGVAHEVKRPLSSIALPAELALMDLNEIADGKKTLESALPNMRSRLQLIIDQTMEAGQRIEVLQRVADEEGISRPVDLAEIVHSSVSRLKDLIARTRVQVNLDLPKSLPAVAGDAQQLEMAVGNLLKNALEASAAALEQAPLKPTPASVTLKSWESNGHVLLSVKDTGDGIKAEIRERLFEPYATTKGCGGMGIGLYLTNKIVRRHGGSIDVTSQEGVGTEFTVRFPKLSQK